MITNDIDAAITIILHSRDGARIKAYYIFGGDTNYILSTKNGKRMLSNQNRQRTISTKSELKKMLGKPYKIEIKDGD